MTFKYMQPRLVGANSTLSALVLLWLLTCVCAPVYGQVYDVVISHGRVLDPESGLDAVRNVGIAGGKIRAISTSALVGKETINARGLVIAPGFIDLHEHGQEDANYRFQARDGVTTSLELELGTDDVETWYAARHDKSLINYGVSVGHIPMRIRVMTGQAGTSLTTNEHRGGGSCQSPRGNSRRTRQVTRSHGSRPEAGCAR